MNNELILQMFGQNPQSDVWSPEGLSQATQGLVPYSVTRQTSKPTTKNLQDMLQAAQLKSYQEQQTGIEEFQKKLANMDPNPVSKGQVIAAGLADLMAGTNKLSQLEQQKQNAEQKQLQANVMLQNMKQNLTKSDIDLLEAQFKAAQENDKLSMTERMLNKKLSAKSGESLLPGQVAADRAFGKEYQDWNAQGGYAGVEKQLKQLEDAAASLEANPDLSGGVGTMLPDVVRRRTNPDAMMIEQNVKQATQAALRQTLGSQFTEKEGEAIMQRSYDPALPAKENIQKIRAAIKELRTRAMEKERASKHFEATGGTLQGLDATSNKQRTKAPAEGDTHVDNGVTYKVQGGVWVRVK